MKTNDAGLTCKPFHSDYVKSAVVCKPLLVLQVAKASLNEKRKVNKKLFEKEPRQASHKFILRVDRFLEMVQDDGLEPFDNLEKLAAISLLEGVRDGQVP